MMIDENHMFVAIREAQQNDRFHKYKITHQKKLLSYDEVLNLWQQDENFRTFFISLLENSPFSAYRWETPPITNQTLNRPFEFVLQNSPALERTPDAKTFDNYFTMDNTNDGIVVFPNLGNNATLVVPSPRCDDAAYGHLATFIRDAPDSQKHALWRTVGETMQQQITDHSLWLSTAGAGVAWLHIRIEGRPKYYGFKAYKTFE